MLKVDDTIRCADAEDCARMVGVLARMGVQTEFLYERDDEWGLWLVVEGVEQ